MKVKVYNIDGAELLVWDKIVKLFVRDGFLSLERKDKLLVGNYNLEDFMFEVFEDDKENN